MKKEELNKKDELIDDIARVLKDNFKIINDNNSETKLIYISDYHKAAKQIIDIVFGNKIMKILNSL